ncbi:MAG: four helix bundle protein [Actinomycetota bacterium]
MAGFEDLLAYRLAVELADDLRHVVTGWPPLDQWTLGVQMIRSADSIAANVAEAEGRGSLADQKRLLLIARGSAYELQHWIERGFARSLMTDDSFRARAARVGQLVNGLLRAYRRRIRAASSE